MTLAELRAIVAVLPADVTQLTLPVWTVRELLGVERLETSVEDKLLLPEEAAARIGVSVDWLYRRTKDLPFARKISRKVTRYSAKGLAEYISLRDKSA